jgi:hypothetical protein
MWYIYFMNKFLVIVPTRNRPNNMVELIQAWKDADTKAELEFAFDEDDPALDEYIRLFNENAAGDLRFWYAVGERLRLGGTLNKEAAENAPYYKYLGFMGDDHRPRTMNWDGKIAGVLDNLETGLAYGNDLVWGEGLPTAVFMTSDIVNKLGYFVPPGMIHLYLDNFWLEFGRAINKIAYLNDVIIEHMHPCVGKAQEDAGYIEVNAQEIYDHDLHVFNEYKKNQMALDVAKIV